MGKNSLKDVGSAEDSQWEVRKMGCKIRVNQYITVYSPKGQKYSKNPACATGKVLFTVIGQVQYISGWLYPTGKL